MEKKKIGILTFHRFLNYGGLLQAYALCKVLNELNYDACVIDYRCDYLENVGNSLFLKKGISLGRNIKKLCSLPVIKKKEKTFSKFIQENIKLSKSYHSGEELQKDEDSFDIFLVGSDQVWNPNWPYDEVYFLAPIKNNEKKASYAASLGDKSIPLEKQSYYKEHLSKLNKIAVREKSDQKVLEELLERKIALTVDPVLLLEKSAWEKFVRQIEKEKYCLIYSVNEPESLVKQAKEYARKKGLKLIYLNPSFWQQFRIGNGKKIKNASPQEFLSYLYYAEAVFTNSFHGTAFASCFEKELYVETESNHKRNKRAADFLDLLGTSDKTQVLEQLRIESLQYLKELVN